MARPTVPVYLCNACGASVHPSRVTVNVSKTAKLLYLASLVVSVIWIWCTFQFLPVDLIPHGRMGLLVAAVYYAGPGVAIAAMAMRVAPIRTTRCGACGHVDVSKRVRVSSRRLVS